MIDNLQLNIFCGCCNLKTGSLVIGTLGWLITLLQLFYLSPLRQRHYNYADSDTIADVFERDVVIEISYGLITLFACILMIYGAYKDNRKCILPWLVVKFVDCVAWTAITIIVFVQFFMVAEILPKLFFFFLLFFDTTLNWYFWVCIWSLYMDLKDKKENNTKQTILLEEIKMNDDDVVAV